MSDHSGSYMLNKILSLLEREQVFTALEKAKTQRLIKEIVQIATQEYDCNSGEILYELAEKFSICEYCLNPSENLSDGICSNCCVD